LIGLLGGAVDITRYHRHKAEILNAMDSAVIALARRGADSDQDADTFVNSYITTMWPAQSRDTTLHMQPFDATEIGGGYRIESHGVMDTAFLPVIGIPDMPLNLITEAMMSGGNYEVALALDNTGSMAERNKIGDLRDAANNLVDTLFEDDGAESRVRMALIPFTHTVNIRGEAFKPEWLDPTGDGLGEHQLDSFDREVNRLDIFAEFSNGRRGSDGLPTAWKGCVEAREGGYDIDDTEPGSNPVTRWTPYLSPDGADRNTGDQRPSYAMQNDYLQDRTNGRGNALERLRNTDKYFSPILGASFDPFDDKKGPNESCRGPIVELTSDRQRMRDAINAMEPGGYTHIPQGLAWGWRVLSPGEPFTQGADYDDGETQKALVLLSDGKNTFPGTYTAYGFRADERLAPTEKAGVRKLNESVTQICEDVKARSIRLYMILFDENDRETQRIFEDCASLGEKGRPLYFFAPDGESLHEAFNAIGTDLTNLRITR
jgi:Mg-chelatase subunit ChlD